MQSNHCRATAIAAAKLGLKSHLILRGSEPNEADGNLLIDKLVNSTISYKTPDEYQKMDETYKLHKQDPLTAKKPSESRLEEAMRPVFGVISIARKS